MPGKGIFSGGWPALRPLASILHVSHRPGGRGVSAYDTRHLAAAVETARVEYRITFKHRAGQARGLLLKGSLLDAMHGL